MKSQIYNIKGKESGTVELPENIFALPWNADLVHQVVTAMMANLREPIAHTKTRGEVRGGGKKPWQQKGLGRARHGSSRSPIWVGGGITHGPRKDKNFSQKINKKMKAKALYTILSRKLKDNEIIFVDELNFKEPKTKEAVGLLKSLAGVKGFERLMTKKVNSAFIAVPAKDKMVEKSFNNFGAVEVGEMRNLNPIQILNHKYFIMSNPAESLKFLTK